MAAFGHMTSFNNQSASTIKLLVWGEVFREYAGKCSNYYTDVSESFNESWIMNLPFGLGFKVSTENRDYKTS